MCFRYGIKKFAEMLIICYNFNSFVEDEWGEPTLYYWIEVKRYGSTKCNNNNDYTNIRRTQGIFR